MGIEALHRRVNKLYPRVDYLRQVCPAAKTTQMLEDMEVLVTTCARSFTEQPIPYSPAPEIKMRLDRLFARLHNLCQACFGKPHVEVRRLLGDLGTQIASWERDAMPHEVAVAEDMISAIAIEEPVLWQPSAIQWGRALPLLRASLSDVVGGDSAAAQPLYGATEDQMNGRDSSGDPLQRGSSGSIIPILSGSFPSAMSEVPAQSAETAAAEQSVPIVGSPEHATTTVPRGASEPINRNGSEGVLPRFPWLTKRAAPQDGWDSESGLPMGALAFTNSNAQQAICGKTLLSGKEDRGMRELNLNFMFVKVRHASIDYRMTAVWVEFIEVADATDPSAQREKEMVYQGLREFHAQDATGFQGVLRDHFREHIAHTQAQWPGALRDPAGELQPLKQETTGEMTAAGDNVKNNNKRARSESVEVEAPVQKAKSRAGRKRRRKTLARALAAHNLKFEDEKAAATTESTVKSG